jgi:DNA repair photolyase
MQHLEETPKKRVNDITSTDIPHGKSINPYLRCEYTGIYSYPKSTYEYFRHSASLDFEQKILIHKILRNCLKKNSKKENLETRICLFFEKKDCYQPAAKKYQLTKK